MLRVGRDEDDVSRPEIGHAPRAVELPSPSRTMIASASPGMDVCGLALVGFGGHFTESPPTGCLRSRTSSRDFDLGFWVNSPSADPMIRIPSSSRMALLGLTMAAPGDLGRRTMGRSSPKEMTFVGTECEGITPIGTQ